MKVSAGLGLHHLVIRKQSPLVSIKHGSSSTNQCTRGWFEAEIMSAAQGMADITVLIWGVSTL